MLPEHHMAKVVLEGKMPGSKAIKERIKQLIAQAEGLSVGFDYPGQTAWLTAAQHAVELVCPSDTNPYCKGARYQVTAGVSSAREAVSGMAALMSRLLEEINGGLFTTIENHAIGVTFDDFLDHGAEYLKHGRKDEAAVMCGWPPARKSYLRACKFGQLRSCVRPVAAARHGRGP